MIDWFIPIYDNNFNIYFVTKLYKYIQYSTSFFLNLFIVFLLIVTNLTINRKKVIDRST